MYFDNPKSESIDSTTGLPSNMESRKALRLLVIDNHLLFREGMLRLLVMEGDFSPVSGSYGEARSLIQHFWPDMVLFSLGNAKERGIRIAGSLRHAFPSLRLLLLDDLVRTRHVREALTMDASGYWTKHACFAKIVAAIHEVISGKQSFCPEVAKYLHKTPAGLRFDPPHEHPALAVLTPREANLFLLLAQGNSIRQSAKQLGIKEQTAENRRLGIMRKLHIHETAELVQLAKKEGIIE